MLGLLVVAFASGIMSAVAGGGGMLTMPFLLAAGIPPINCLAIIKLQGFFGLMTSAWTYSRSGLLELNRIRPALVFGALGSALGVWLAHLVSSQFLQLVLPILLIAVAVYMLFFNPRPGETKPARISDKTFNPVVGSATGVYAGFFGPGIGCFLIVAFTSLRGDELRSAVANSKPLLVATNLVAAVTFMFTGHMLWLLGLSMAAAQALGAHLGTRIAITRGIGAIRPFFLIVTIATAIKLLID